MKKFALKNVAAAAGAVLALAVGNAFAAPEFTINQGAITGGTYQNPQMFTGTQFSGNSSELVRFSAGDTMVDVNSGFLRFGTIFNSNTASGVGLNTSSFAGNYGLYLLFNFTAAYNASTSTGGPGAAGSQYDITALSFTVYADTTGNTTFQTANATGAGTEANRTGGFADDVVLGFGSLLSTANPDVAGFDSGGGAFENALTNFAICTGAGTARVGATNIPVRPVHEQRRDQLLCSTGSLLPAGLQRVQQYRQLAVVRGSAAIWPLPSRSVR